MVWFVFGASVDALHVLHICFNKVDVDDDDDETWFIWNQKDESKRSSRISVRADERRTNDQQHRQFINEISTFFYSLLDLGSGPMACEMWKKKKENCSEGGVMEWRKINISCCRWRCVLFDGFVVGVVVRSLFSFFLFLRLHCVRVPFQTECLSRFVSIFFSRSSYAHNSHAQQPHRWYRRFNHTDNDNDVIVDDVTLICIENGFFLHQTTLTFRIFFHFLQIHWHDETAILWK